MTGIRSWVALGLALTWGGVSLAQDSPDAPDPDVPARVEVRFRGDGGVGEVQTQPAPTHAAVKGRIRPDGVNAAAPGIQNYLIQEVSPDASRRVVHELLATGAQPTQWPLFFRGIPNDQGLGASFEPADDSVRAQLDVPAGQGLVVTSVAPGGPAARIGIVANDIMLTLGDKPLGTVDDLAKAMKSVGEEPVTLKLLRAGKPVTVRVKPEHHVTLGPVATVRSRYQIGVQVTPLEGALRSHLGLPDDQGLLVSRVEERSAAEKAGLKKNDVLVSIGDQPLTGTENLVARVQESGGKPISLKVLRSGKSQTVELAPVERKETIDVTVTLPERTVFTAVRPTQTLSRWARGQTPAIGQTPRMGPQPPASAMTWSLHAPGAPADSQLNDLVREVRELRRAVEELQKALKSNEGAPGKDR